MRKTEHTRRTDGEGEKKQVSKGLMRDMHVHRTYELYSLINGDREYFIEDRFFTVKTVVSHGPGRLFRFVQVHFQKKNIILGEHTERKTRPKNPI